MSIKNSHGLAYGAAGAVAAIAVCAGAMVLAPASHDTAVQHAPVLTARDRPQEVPPVHRRPPVRTPRGMPFLQKEEAQGGDCVLVVPPNPLSAQGLATPYQLSNGPNTTGCTMANAANLGAFVQATILEPGGKLFAYDPLVITAGTTPAAMPPVPVIPAGSVTTIDTGFQGNILFLRGAGARSFVQGLPGSPFGQVAFANGPAFFAAAKAANVAVPALGTSPADGMTCPTVRDFSLVDQDQSDNVTSTYLVTAGGQTALPGSGVTGTLVGNGSDNRLINHFIDPALGCTGAVNGGFSVPSLSSPGTVEATQATDELFAAANQKAPVALPPPNDPMVTVGADIDIIPNDFPTAGNLSVFKTDLYRAELGQPPAGFNTVATAAQYCTNLKAAGARVMTDAQLPAEIASNSPVAGMNLSTFMTARYAASLVLLNCKLFAPTAVAPVPTATPAPVPTVTATPTVAPAMTATDPATVAPSAPAADPSAATTAPGGP